MSLEQKVSLSNANRANRALGKQDYKTLGLSALGGALEFYDFVIYVFFAVVVSKLFFPADMPEWLKQLQTYGIFAAGYLARPLGGIIMAHFGDLLGRKRMFTLSIFLMAIPTLLMGLMPTYATIGVAAPIILLLLRVMQGAAIGGEVPGAWVFVSEHVPARHTGLATGILTSGLTAGILLGSLMAVLINRIYSPAEIQAWAWRIPFIVGGAFGFIAMFLRRWLEETPVFTEMKAQRALSSGVPLFGVFKGNGLSVIVSMLLTWILSAAIVVVILMTPTLIQKSLGITPLQAFIANSWAIIALSIGAVFFGYLADRIGAGKATLLGSLLLCVSSYHFYSNLASHPEQLIANYILVGFAVGVVGSFALTMVRGFPAKVRFSGLSFSYNTAYAIFGGMTPVLVAAGMKNTLLMPMYYVMAMSVLGMLIGLFLWLKKDLFFKNK
jgi:MFS family permease